MRQITEFFKELGMMVVALILSVVALAAFGVVFLTAARVVQIYASWLHF